MPPDPKLVQDIFLRLAALPPAEQMPALGQECGLDAELQQRVAALLKAHGEADSFLDRLGSPIEATYVAAAPAAGSAGHEEPGFIAPNTQNAAISLAATVTYGGYGESGQVVAGRYRLDEKIGEGGMGEVWVAKQTEPVKRKVALKLIKTGMDSKLVVQRFEQERQALALMDHPHIARVLDGGLTPSGRPFFVMELVNGLPLNQFCDEAKLTLPQRLELFVPICQAIQHAHQKGIVHRDLKPANILVTLVDGRAVPKVIDFGVAKATAGKLIDQSMSTGFGAIVGTLEYMAPEQAGFSSVDIDTRADIYSLGVILYELLTGLRPIDAMRLKQAALTEMIRIIQDEEPSKPSTRLSTDASLPSVAAVRQTDPKKLMALLRGELDWVVMKCLEKQRARRYETANALGRDIQRFLADEPVEARPPSTGYRVGKFLKRHKGAVAAVSLLLLALLAGIAGTSYGLVEARNSAAAESRAKNDANIKRAEAEAAGALARAEEEAGRKLLYTTDMQLAPFVWKDDRSTAGQLRTLLAKHIPDSTAPALGTGLPIPPAADKPDLRGFEWHYYQHLLENSAAVFSGHESALAAGTLAYEGQLVTLDANGQIRRWDVDSRYEDEAKRRDLPGGPTAQVRVLSPDGRLAALANGDKVRVFETSTGRETCQIDSANDEFRSLIFSPDSARLVIVDDQIRWLDAVSGEVIAAVNQKFSDNRILRSVGRVDNFQPISLTG